MNKTVLATLIMASVSLCSMNANAGGESTISLGYAQSHVKQGGDKLKENPKGLNVKYRYEFDDNWGVLGSFAYTHQGYEYRHNQRKVGSGDLDYYSLTAGPTYRFNDYISLYGLIGATHGKAEVKSDITNYQWSESKTALGYGAGIQVNPLPNIAIDASYEYSKLSDVKVGTWMLGVGYRF